MWAAIKAIAAAFFGALVGALRTRRQDSEHDAAIRGEAVDEAALETREVITDAADARSSLPPPPTDRSELARQLRAERNTPSAGGGQGDVKNDAGRPKG